MARLLFTILTAFVFSVLPGCNGHVNEVTDPNVVNIEEGDADMMAAFEKAKSSFDFFEKNWKTMENDGYSLKFSLRADDGQYEHIWFSPTKIEGEMITGECANVPRNISGLSLGDSRTVGRDTVSDWMIIVGNKCFGGYTIRVMAERDPDRAPKFEFVDPPSA